MTVPLSSFTGTLDVNSLGGDDSITVSNLALLAGQSLDIDGGAGTDSVTWGSANSLDAVTVTADTITLSSNVTTTGAQNWDGAVTLSTNLTVNGSAVTFGGTIDGTRSLNITSGSTVTLSGAIGAGTPLTSLTIPGSSVQTNLNAGVVTTTGSQTYAGEVLLDSATDATVITATSVGFGSASGDWLRSVTNGEEALTLNISSGQSVISAAVGTGGQRLKSFTTSGAGLFTTTFQLHATEDITIGTAVNNRFHSVSGRDITFTNTVNGAATLTSTISATGDLSFQADVGTTTPLVGANLTADAITFGGDFVSGNNGITANATGTISLAGDMSTGATADISLTTAQHRDEQWLQHHDG